jgi:HD superfamily phosphohydrolase
MPNPTQRDAGVNQMEITDKLYGTFNITEPVLIELLSSQCVERLRGIRQYGLPPEYYGNGSFSRHEHSVGTMLLLRLLGAGLIEQAAGLLHDISHTAFSHVTDSVLGGPSQTDTQDERHIEYLLSSGVADVLICHGLDPAQVADLKSHRLLEREAPELCADRIDYALREFAFQPNTKSASYYLARLSVHKGNIVFANKSSAESFSTFYLQSLSREWAGVEKTVRQHLFAHAIRRALEDGTIRMDDLFLDDGHVLQKLQAARNPSIRAALELLSKRLDMEPAKEDAHLEMPRYFRYVDPLFFKDGALCRLTDESAKYRRLVEKRRRTHNKGIKVNLVNNRPLLRKIR